METVAIYTDTDTVELSVIFERMLDQLDTNPPVELSESKDKIEDYFASIVPDYAQDRVYLSDMKKVIKWFDILKDKGLLDAVAEVEPSKD